VNHHHLSLPQGRPALLVLLVGLTAALPLPRAAADDIEQEPWRYSATTPNNAIARLEQRLKKGQGELKFDKRLGYLPALLRELDVLPSSQMLVFSKTSLQRKYIGPPTPRALYFNEDIYIGYCHNSRVMEISAVDPKLGTVFYTLEPDAAEKPHFLRQTDNCLLCHCSSHTHNVPGHVVRSVIPDIEGNPILSAGTYRIDQTSPLEKRWGGWYVTGTSGKQAHLGNLLVYTKTVNYPIDNAEGLNQTKLHGRVDPSRYLTSHSDIVALMVLEHQAEAQNLLTQANYQTRLGLYQEAALNKELGQPLDQRRESTNSRIKSVGDALLRYLLFSREAPLTDKITGTSKFAEEFQARGPRDGKGRSLRDLDLQTRLFKYPCSYLLYSTSFDGLPEPVREYVLAQLWEVLHGRESGNDFNHLSMATRRTLLEILVATKPNLPAYWREKQDK
jgi:hypothetical protein